MSLAASERPRPSTWNAAAAAAGTSAVALVVALWRLVGDAADPAICAVAGVGAIAALVGSMAARGMLSRRVWRWLVTAGLAAVLTAPVSGVGWSIHLLALELAWAGLLIAAPRLPDPSPPQVDSDGGPILGWVRRTPVVLDPEFATTRTLRMLAASRGLLAAIVFGDPGVPPGEARWFDGVHVERASGGPTAGGRSWHGRRADPAACARP